MKSSVLKSAGGVSMMELVVILTILGTMVAATSGIVLKVVRDQTRSQFISQVISQGEVYRSSLSDNKAWRETVQRNASLLCLKDVTDCTGKGGNFSPFDAGGAAVIPGYDPTTGNNGFDVHGNPCNTYNPNPQNSDGRCVFQFRFRWTPLNCVAPCLNPEIRIDFDLAFSIPEGSSLLPVPRAETHKPSPLFRAGTQMATPPATDCGPKEVVIGFNNNDGSKVCAPSTAFPLTPPCQCPKGGCTCSKGVCSCPNQCGKQC